MPKVTQNRPRLVNGIQEDVQALLDQANVVARRATQLSRYEKSSELCPKPNSKPYLSDGLLPRLTRRGGHTRDLRL